LRGVTGAATNIRQWLEAAMTYLAPDVLRAVALVLCVWAVLSIGDGRHDR